MSLSQWSRNVTLIIKRKCDGAPCKFSVLVYNTIKYVSCIRYAICITGTRSVGRADQSLWRGEQEREKEQSQSPSLPGTVRVVLCLSVVFA